MVHVARMIGKPEGKRPLRGHRQRREDSINMHLGPLVGVAVSGIAT
jgi:hypothetical protein